jgi:hypothetical protein
MVRRNPQERLKRASLRQNLEIKVNAEVTTNTLQHALSIHPALRARGDDDLDRGGQAGIPTTLKW